MAIREIKTQFLTAAAIKDTSNKTVIDLTGHTINDTANSVVAIDINNHQLLDTGGVVSIDFTAHQLYNSSGQSKLNWDGAGLQLNSYGANITLTPDTFVVDVSNSNIINVLDPVNPLDAVNKQYADGISAGLNPKQATRVASTADLALTYVTSPSNGQFTGVPLTGLYTIDGTLLVTGDRLLVKDQTDPKQNGIFVYDGGAGTLTRSTDMDGTPANEVAGGDFTFVQTGTLGAGQGFVVVHDGNIVLNTDPVNWTQFAGSNNFAFRDLSNLVPTAINQPLNFATGVLGSVRTADDTSSQSITLRSGDGSAGATGDVNIFSGAPSPGNTSGGLNLTSGSATSGNVSGQISVVTGTVDTATSGAIVLNTGATTSTGGTGGIELITGDASGTGTSSGVVTINTGAVGAGASGAINMSTGTSVGTASGAVTINTGSSSTDSGAITIATASVVGNVGNINIQAGAGGGQGAAGGSILLMTSAGFSPDASIQIMGVGTAPTPLRFYDNTNGAYVAFQAAAAVTNTTWTLPVADGTAGQSLITNGSGILSWAESNAWTKYTLTYSSFSTAALTNSLTLFSLVAKGTVEEVVIKHSTAFSGTGITAYTVAVGITGTVDKYATAFDVFSAVSGTNFQTSDSFGMENFGSATNILVTATSVGANLNAAAGAGSVDIWVRTSVLP